MGRAWCFVFAVIAACSPEFETSAPGAPPFGIFRCAGPGSKFYEESVLLKQKFVKDDKQQIKDILPDGVTIKSFVRMQLGG